MYSWKNKLEWFSVKTKISSLQIILFSIHKIFYFIQDRSKWFYLLYWIHVLLLLELKIIDIVD